MENERFHVGSLIDEPGTKEAPFLQPGAARRRGLCEARKSVSRDELDAGVFHLRKLFGAAEACIKDALGAE